MCANEVCEKVSIIIIFLNLRILWQSSFMHSTNIHWGPIRSLTLPSTLRWQCTLVTLTSMKNTHFLGVIWYNYHNWKAKYCLWEWHQETILHLLKWDILIMPMYKADVQFGIGESKEKKLAIRDKLCQIQLEVMECTQMGIPMGRKHGKIFQRSSEKMNLKLKLWKEINEVVSCYCPFLLFKQKMDTQKSGENQQQTAQSNLLGSWSVTSVSEPYQGVP